jgi:integrase
MVAGSSPAGGIGKWLHIGPFFWIGPSCLSPEEVWALVRAAASEHDGTLYLTAAFTGLRRGELLALHWRDVDFAGSTIRVRASYAGGQLTTPKSGKVRAVPMAPDVASALAQLGQREDWVGGDDLVFAGLTGGYLDGSALCRRYKMALTRAGLRQLRFHDLRHTFGTRMIAKADIRRVQEGWATPTSRPR